MFAYAGLGPQNLQRTPREPVAETNIEPETTNSELGTEREHEPRTEKLGTVKRVSRT